MTDAIPTCISPVGSSDRAGAVGGASTQGTRYEIRVTGHLDERWSAWFDDFAVRADPDGSTSITGSIVDQAALHGVLTRVRDLGLELLSVAQIAG
ncbi:MAG TPA: hypothetical protein VIG28_06995 [Leifsonia sp.]